MKLEGRRFKAHLSVRTARRWGAEILAALCVALLVSCRTMRSDVVSQTLQSYRTNVTTLADFERDAGLRLEPRPGNPFPLYVVSSNSVWAIYKQGWTVKGAKLFRPPKFEEVRLLVGNRTCPLCNLTFTNGILAELEFLQ